MLALLTILSLGVTQLVTFGDHTIVVAFQQVGDFTLLLTQQSGASQIEAAVNKLVETLKAIGRPIAILGLVLLALSWLAAGILPDWAQQNKGLLVKMLMGGILLGIAPDVVGLVLPK